MKKLISFLLYVASLGYVFFAFSTYSSQFSIMPWYEPAQMGIQLGLGMIRFGSAAILIVLCVLLLFRKQLGFMLKILFLSVVTSSLPAFTERVLSIGSVEYLGSGVCIALFIMSSFVFLNQMKRDN